VRLIEYMRDSLIFLDIEADEKEQAIAQTVELMKKSDVITNAPKFLEDVLEREKLGCTSIGKGIALPHARTSHIDQIVIAMTRLKNGIDFDAADEEPVNLLFLLGTPLRAVGEYLNVLSRLSRILKDEKIHKRIMAAQSSAEIRTIFEQAEE